MTLASIRVEAVKFVNRALAILAGAVLIVTSGVAEESWQQRSEHEHFEGRLAPRDGEVRIGSFQDWVLELRSPDGEPIGDARIAVGGGMPGHGHGLPTQPMVTGYLGEGRYVIEGVKLSMAGQWLIVFGIETRTARDRLMFDMQIDHWSEDELRLFRSLYLDPATKPPPSPSNRVADNPDAADLGETLFFDERLSVNGALSCATCHQPERFFTDGLPRGVGVSRSGRNTPTVIGAAFLSWFYWDGRRDTLWSQALVPFEAADEMGGSRVAVVRHVGVDDDYRSRNERIFGPFPPSVLSASLPEHAGPLGEAPLREAWSRIDRSLAQQINTVYANLGKAIAAYQRTLPLPRTRFDRYVEAVLEGKPRQARRILSASERAGLELYIDDERSHCLRCHNGSWFTNGGFHNIGTGSFTGEHLDFGRVFGVRSVIMDEFNCLGPYSDTVPEQCTELRFLNRSTHVPLDGAFKVPGLRNVAATAPYMHDGRFADLESVIEFYREQPETQQAHELPQLDISDKEARQLVAFLKALSVETDAGQTSER